MNTISVITFALSTLCLDKVQYNPYVDTMTSACMLMSSYSINPSYMLITTNPQTIITFHWSVIEKICIQFQAQYKICMRYLNTLPIPLLVHLELHWQKIVYLFHSNKTFKNVRHHNISIISKYLTVTRPYPPVAFSGITRPVHHFNIKKKHTIAFKSVRICIISNVTRPLYVSPLPIGIAYVPFFTANSNNSSLLQLKLSDLVINMLFFKYMYLIIMKKIMKLI